MANIHVGNRRKSASVSIGSNRKENTSVSDSTMPKYVGARATVTRTDEGILIWMSDYKGETYEVIDDSAIGTTDYNALLNKPQIEGVTLSGNQMFPDLNLDTLTNTEIQEIFDNLI